ncbi:MAG: hypothetical protein IPL75_09005 [Acidobacteria bacterium]|nr:hypothetical protein [Acidobacteriota bacterium]
MTSERILRAAAVLIAVAAVVDPAFLRSTQVRPTVVVAHATASDRDLAARVAAALESTFAVSRVDVAGAAAYVLAGSDVPEEWRPPQSAVVFAVTPGGGTLGLRVLDLKVPAQASIDSVAPVVATVSVDGSGDREVTVALVVDGLRMQEVKARVAGDDTRITVPLTFVPARPGLARVRVEATATGRTDAAADAVLDVTARVWRVLAFDGRPTYAATFVRRALETDARFQVTTRIVTSRASAVQTGPAPASLTDPRALDGFDLVVVGAADALGASEAASLERYLRERHGAVVLLPEGTDDPVLFRLTGQATWQEDRRAEPVRVEGGEGFTASEFFWPSRWPPLAAPLATFGQADPSAARRFPVADACRQRASRGEQRDGRVARACGRRHWILGVLAVHRRRCSQRHTSARERCTGSASPGAGAVDERRSSVVLERCPHRADARHLGRGVACSALAVIIAICEWGRRVAG